MIKKLQSALQREAASENFESVRGRRTGQEAGKRDIQTDVRRKRGKDFQAFTHRFVSALHPQTGYAQKAEQK